MPKDTKYIKDIKNEWKRWLTIIHHTLKGVETIVWTLYGSVAGQFVVVMHNSFENGTPKFFYAMPIWIFLIGFYSVIKN